MILFKEKYCAPISLSLKSLIGMQHYVLNENMCIEQIIACIQNSWTRALGQYKSIELLCLLCSRSLDPLDESIDGSGPGSIQASPTNEVSERPYHNGLGHGSGRSPESVYGECLPTVCLLVRAWASTCIYMHTFLHSLTSLLMLHHFRSGHGTQREQSESNIIYERESSVMFSLSRPCLSRLDPTRIMAMNFIGKILTSVHQ